MSKPIAIIGAGNGGQAFAGYLSLLGREVKIFDVVQATVDRLSELGGVNIQGNSKVTGFGKVELASTDIGAVMEGSEIILVVLPSIYHKSMAEKMAPYLKDGQIVVLNPNASLGPVEFKNALKNCGCDADVIIVGTSTLLFACRAREVGQVEVSGQKKGLTAAAYPAKYNDYVAEKFADIIPEFEFRDDIIRVSLDNLNAMMHPAPTLLYTAKIEHQEDFEYYLDLTPSQGALIEALDAERMALGKAFGLELRTLVDEYKHTYDTFGNSMYEVVTNAVSSYTGIKGQKTMRTRYLQEDIPYSLVALQTMGEVAGVPTPCIDAVVTVARAIIPDMDEGRTAKNLGLENVTKEEFEKMCREG